MISALAVSHSRWYCFSTNTPITESFLKAGETFTSVGADVFASDLNPVAVLLNKVVLDYLPRYGARLADEVRKCLR